MLYASVEILFFFFVWFQWTIYMKRRHNEKERERKRKKDSFGRLQSQCRFSMVSTSSDWDLRHINHFTFNIFQTIAIPEYGHTHTRRSQTPKTLTIFRIKYKCFAYSMRAQTYAPFVSRCGWLLDTIVYGLRSRITRTNRMRNKTPAFSLDEYMCVRYKQWILIGQVPLRIV